MDGFISGSDTDNESSQYGAFTQEEMSAYLITNLDVKDANDFEEYRAKVPALIRKHGGEYLVRGGTFIAPRKRRANHRKKDLVEGDHAERP
jgi:hypothetical protein